MTKWILMPVEVKNREFYSRLLLASIATQRGFKVLLGQDRVIRRLLPYLPHGIVFDKSIGRQGDKKVKRFSKHNYLITALDEEATGYLSGPESFAAPRLSEEALDVTKRWFCLSEPIRQDIMTRFPNHHDRFVTTGLARTDIWRPQFHPIYEDETNKLRAKYGKFILFNSNFATVIHARGDAFTDNQMARNTKYYNDYTKNKKAHKKQEWANLDAYVEMLPKLADKFPDHKLIVRPHPADDVNFWKDSVGSHPNIEVIFEGNVTPWILASDCMVHHGCTTGIEAELMSKPHVMYAPSYDAHHESEIMQSFATIVKSEKDLFKVIGEMLKGSKKYGKKKKALEKYYASLQGKLVCEKVVDEFEKFAEEGKPLSKWLSLLRFLPRQLVADYWPRSKRAKAYSLQKWDGTSIEEVSTRLAAINKALGSKTGQSVKQVYPSLFEISAE